MDMHTFARVCAQSILYQTLRTDIQERGLHLSEAYVPCVLMGHNPVWARAGQTSGRLHRSPRGFPSLTGRTRSLMEEVLKIGFCRTTNKTVFPRPYSQSQSQFSLSVPGFFHCLVSQVAAHLQMCKTGSLACSPDTLVREHEQRSFRQRL